MIEAAAHFRQMPAPARLAAFSKRWFRLANSSRAAFFPVTVLFLRRPGYGHAVGAGMSGLKQQLVQPAAFAVRPLRNCALPPARASGMNRRDDGS